MEKLIQLLNKYEYDKRREKNLRWMTNWCIYYIQSINPYLNLKIISKEYWFIKWLLCEEKIDTKYLDTVTVRDKIFKVEKRKSWEERLLMLLAIQDEPIEFLISILK